MALTMHVVSHTHWDREWYRPYQVFRARLVQLIDDLLDLLERDTQYRYFHLDGQTIVLEDYLQIRPEQAARLNAMLRAGRILVGPWYTQPDEFLVSGEAMVRNLLRGRRMARAVGGGSMELGYLPDSFGHAGQMPQIFAGFDFPAAVVFRGVTADQSRAAFQWRGSDGTRLLAIKLPDDDAYSNYLYRLQGTLSSAGPIDEARLERELGRLREDCAAQAVCDQYLWMDGVDHIYANPRTPGIIEFAARYMPDAQVIHTTLPRFVDALKEANPDLPELAGELRRANRAWRLQAVLANVASSHVRIKQANLRLQTALERVVEPLCAFAWLNGQPYPGAYLDLAWTYLLQNHAHDSICGCSVDQVHREMMHRFGQADQVAGLLQGQALAALAGQADTTCAGEGAAALIYNPLPWARSGVSVVEVELPPDAQGRLARDVVVRDAGGSPVPHQLLGQRDRQTLAQPRYDIPSMYRRRVYRIALDIALPGYGFAALGVTPAASPQRSSESLFTGAATMENENLRVGVAPDGTLSLTHKPSGRTFEGLLALEDRGDCGEGWNWIPPQFDRVYLSPGSPWQVSRSIDGPWLAAMKLCTRLRVPAGLAGAANEHDPARAQRSADEVEIPVEFTIQLSRTAQQLDVEMSLDNRARNHRLRLLFPTEVNAPVCHADGAFDVVERPVTQPDSRDWVEPQLGTYPHHSFVCVDDASAGLAVLTAGTMEYEVMDDPRRTLAITLLRAFGRGPGEPEEYLDSQEPGLHTYRFGVRPYAGAWDQAGVVRASRDFALPPVARMEPAHAGALAPGRPLLEVEGAGIDVTAVKRCDARDSLLIRCVNLGEAPQGLTVRCSQPLAAAYRLNLAEERLAPVVVADDGTIKLTVSRREIVSLELAPAAQRS